MITQADLLGGAHDVDSGTLTITALTLNSGNGTLVDNHDGTWSYTPAADDDTGVSFDYTVSDGALDASSTAALDITPVNDPPVLTGTPAVLAGGSEDTPYTIHEADLLAGYTDIDGGDLRVSSLSAVNGVLTDNLDGTWTSRPTRISTAPSISAIPSWTAMAGWSRPATASRWPRSTTRPASRAMTSVR